MVLYQSSSTSMSVGWSQKSRRNVSALKTEAGEQSLFLDEVSVLTAAAGREQVSRAGPSSHRPTLLGRASSFCGSPPAADVMTSQASLADIICQIS